jgi:hypothetical protein
LAFLILSLAGIIGYIILYSIDTSNPVRFTGFSGGEKELIISLDRTYK